MAKLDLMAYVTTHVPNFARFLDSVVTTASNITDYEYLCNEFGGWDTPDAIYFCYANTRHTNSRVCDTTRDHSGICPDKVKALYLRICKNNASGNPSQNTGYWDIRRLSTYLESDKFAVCLLHPELQDTMLYKASVDQATKRLVVGQLILNAAFDTPMCTLSLIFQMEGGTSPATFKQPLTPQTSFETQLFTFLVGYQLLQTKGHRVFKGRKEKTHEIIAEYTNETNTYNILECPQCHKSYSSMIISALDGKAKTCGHESASTMLDRLTNWMTRVSLLLKAKDLSALKEYEADWLATVDLTGTTNGQPVPLPSPDGGCFAAKDVENPDSIKDTNTRQAIAKAKEKRINTNIEVVEKQLRWVADNKAPPCWRCDFVNRQGKLNAGRSGPPWNKIAWLVKQGKGAPRNAINYPSIEITKKRKRVVSFA